MFIERKEDYRSLPIPKLHKKIYELEKEIDELKISLHKVKKKAI